MTSEVPRSLVLSEALSGTDETVAVGKRIHDLLAPYLDALMFTAVGVIHGKSNSSRKAWRRSQDRIFEKRGLLHLDIDKPLADLIGDRATEIATAFAEAPDYVMAFYAPLSRRTNWLLTKSSLLPGDIDTSFLQAGLDLPTTDSDSSSEGAS